MTAPLPPSTPDPITALTSLYDKLEAEKAKTGSYDKIFIRQVGDSADNMQKNIQFEKKNWFSKLLIFFRKKEQYDVEKIANTFNTAFGKIDKNQLDSDQKQKLANLQAHLNQIFQHKVPNKTLLQHDFGTKPSTQASTSSATPPPPSPGTAAPPSRPSGPPPPKPTPEMLRASQRKKAAASAASTLPSTGAAPHSPSPAQKSTENAPKKDARQFALTSDNPVLQRRRDAQEAQEQQEQQAKKSVSTAEQPSQEKSLVEQIRELSFPGTNSAEKFKKLVNDPLFEKAKKDPNACLVILEKLFSDSQKVAIFGNSDPKSFTFDDTNIEKFVQAIEGDKLPDFKKDHLQTFIKVFNNTYTPPKTKEAAARPLAQQPSKAAAGIAVSAEELQQMRAGLGGRRGRSQAKEATPASTQKAQAETAQDVTFDTKSVTQKQKFAELMSMPIFDKTLKENNKKEALILFGKVFDLPDVTENTVKSTANDEWKVLLRLSSEQQEKLDNLIRVATG